MKEETFYRFDAQEINQTQWNVLTKYLKKHTKFIESEETIWINELKKEETIELKISEFRNKKKIQIRLENFKPLSYKYLYTSKRDVTFRYQFNYSTKIHQDIVNSMKPLKSLSDFMQGYWFPYSAPFFFDNDKMILWSNLGTIVILLNDEEYQKFIDSDFELIECEENYGFYKLHPDKIFYDKIK